MARANSAATRVRQWVIRKIEPFPDLGEAWCIDCRLNGGKTQIFPENSMRSHVMKHQSTDFVKVVASQKKNKITGGA